MYEEEFEDT